MAINKRLLVKPPSTGITPSEHFGVMLYEGDGSSSNSINGGKFGGAASFNGSSSTIVIPNAIEQPLKGAKEFGVSMWFNLASLPTGSDEDFLISLYQEGYLDIRIKANGVIQGKVAENSSGTDRIVTSANSVIAANTWYHVVWTGKTNDLKLYINGSSIATGSTWNGTFYHSNVGCRIGSKSGPSYYFNGKIDQTRIFQKQLSSSEVTTLYTETVDTVESLTPLGNETIDTLQVLGDTSCTSLYRFENNETDLSGNYDGTGVKIQYAAGRYGQAIEFGARGNNSYLDITKATTPTTSSISFWLKTSYSDNQWRVIADGGGSQSSGTGWAIFVTGNGTKINPYFTNGQTGYSQSIEGTKNIADGVWHHVVLTMASDNGFVLYLDGQSHISGTRTRWTSGDTHSVSNVRFGNIIATSANANNQFYGEIDQIRTFNKSLSASEVTTLYQESPLIASYRFEGNVNDDMATYHGTPTNVTTEYGLGFTPDLIWYKTRTQAYDHSLTDSTRGTGKQIRPNRDIAEVSATDHILSFDTGGFTVGAGGDANKNGDDYVAWCWKANGGTTSTNNDGNIASTVQLNADAGFAITKVTGSGTTDTFGHGLGAVPEVMIRKDLSATDNWTVYTTVIDGSLDYMRLNNTDAAGDSGYNMPTSTVFTNPGNTNNYIYYSFISIDGFSKFGSYTGNADANGPVVETGFEPAFLMIKRTSATDNWVMIDNRRSPINPKNRFVWANKSDAESTFVGTREVNFYSNGFQPVSDGADDINDNNAKYFYMAFAADPDTEAPVVAKSFNTAVYSGNLSANGPILDIGFNPGFVWIKAIETTSTGDKSHRLHDVIRGQQSFLNSDTSNAASSSGDRLNFNYSDTQIQITNASKGWNDNGYRYVAWAWKADDNEPTIFGGPAKAVYKFEDNVNDVTGNFNGSASSVAYTSSGKFNKAAVFNGTSSYINIGDNDFKDSRFSISTWIYVTSTVNGQTIYNGYDEQPNEAAGTLIRLDSNNKVQVNGWNPPSTYGGEVKSNSSLSLNTWHHIVVTLQHGSIKIYIDGNIDASGSISSFGYHSTHNFIIGAHKKTGQSASNFFNGRLDQFRYYRGIISDLGAKALYAETTSNNDDLNLGKPKETIISANANAGFSIVKWEGTGTQTKIPHGLSAVPEMIISKRLDSTNNWSVYHKSLDLSHSTYPNWAYLNLTNAQQNSGSAENHPYYARPSASHIFQNTGTSEGTNVAGAEYISYCWHSVSGYSAFGYWQGGTTTINIGFRADFVLYQDFGAGGSWTLVDSARGDDKRLYAHSSAAEGSQSLLTITDTGFTVTSESSVVKRLYMAFKIN